MTHSWAIERLCAGNALCLASSTIHLEAPDAVSELLSRVTSMVSALRDSMESSEMVQSAPVPASESGDPLPFRQPVFGMEQPDLALVDALDAHLDDPGESQVYSNEKKKSPRGDRALAKGWVP